MARFAYKAVTSSGDLLEGEMEAATRQAVVDRLRGLGHTPIRADELKGRAQAALSRGRLFAARRLSPGAVALFTRELATLLRAGLPLDRALMILGEIAEDARRREIVGRVLEAVRGGSSLADALEVLKDSLPPYYIGLVRAGEAGGSLDTVLTRLADVLERAQTLRESVRSAMYYPAFVLVMSVLTVVVLFTLVVPQFRPLFEDSTQPVPTPMAIIMSLSDALQHYGWALLGAIIAVILVIRIQLGRPAGRLGRDRLILRLPLMGQLIMKVEASRFARTLGTLLANGVVVLSALSITAGTIGNRAVAQAVDGITGHLKRGEGLAKPLMETGVFPRLAVRLIQVGEESGQLETMLLRVADIYDEEVKQSLQRIISLLVPVVTIFLGFIVAAIIGSMLTAILSTYDLPV
jgi:general secretion pathway protein F